MQMKLLTENQKRIFIEEDINWWIGTQKLFDYRQKSIFFGNQISTSASLSPH